MNYLFNIAIKELFKFKYFILFFIVYLAYFFIFHHDETNCLVKLTIGIPCMTCGMSRAFVSLIFLDFKQAFHFHPLIFIVPFIFTVLLFRETKFMGKIYHSKIWWSTILLLFVVVYIIRMFLYFPHTGPMDYYSNPLILRILLS